MNSLHRLSAWTLFAIVAGGYWTLAQFFPVTYVSMTYEDLYGEWMQVWQFFAIFVLSAMQARRPGPYRWFFIFLSFAGLYTFLEEISYGQRLFQVESPEFFEEYNIQGETNLHNFFTGPESTLLKDVIQYTMLLALLTYGFIYPLTLRLGFAPAVLLNRFGVAPPPLYLAPFFMTASILEVGWFNFNEAEVAEILVGTGVVGMLLHYRFAGYQSAETGLPARPSSRVARAQAWAYLMLFTVLVGLAWGTTWLANSQPHIAERSAARLINGYKKYAPRMEMKGRWAHAAEFYRLAHEGLNGDVDMLDSAIKSYKAAGDVENYRRYYRRQLERSIAERGRSTGVDTHLAFARAYAEIEDAEGEVHHMERAQFFAAQRIRSFPDNPDNHYWQGRVLQQAGDYELALAAYAKAAELAPDERRYRAAIDILQRGMRSGEE